MKTVIAIASSFLLSMSVACASQTEPSSGTQGEQTSPVTGQPADVIVPAPAPTCKPLAKATTGTFGAPGLANPASVQCTALGYRLVGDQCVFPDGASCEEWSFYRGACGQAHSFCNLHGGSVSNKVEDMGGWTASYALCTLPSGSQCHDDAFAHSCTCE